MAGARYTRGADEWEYTSERFKAVSKGAYLALTEVSSTCES